MFRCQPPELDSGLSVDPANAPLEQRRLLRAQGAPLCRLPRRYDLIPTGGSDYHGFPMGDAAEVDNDVGSVVVPEETVERLRARART